MKRFWNWYKTRVYTNFIGKLSFTDGIHYWRSKLFYAIILYLLPLALILLIPSIILAHFMKLYGLAIAYVIFAAVITFISLNRGLDIKKRKYLFLGLLYLVAVSLIYFMGEHGAGITYLFGITVFALLILPVKAGKITVYLNILICLLHGALIYFGLEEYPLREHYQVLSWLLISANSILLSITAVIFMPMLLSGLQEIIEEQNELEKALRKQQKELEISLNEKETMLAEIHHRVKNNLAVISGMLQMQSFKESDEHIRKKLLASTLRIKSMANIHEQLYQSHSFSNISFNEGIETLVQTILETLQNGVVIKTEFNLQEIELNINQALPCSLIINEVITNSVKHAFKDQTQGILSISLSRNGDQVSIQILDNGSGMPQSDNTTATAENSSLGMELINALAVQLNADYIYKAGENGNGTRFEITFEMKG